MREVIDHEWFKKELPLYLFPAETEQDASIIDMEAVGELCEKYNCSVGDVEHALLCGDVHNQLAVAYNLIVDDKRMLDETSKLNIDEFFNMAPSPRSAAALQRHSNST